MKLGLSLPVFTANAGRSLDAARRAVAGGYDGVFAPDHLFPPGHPDRPSLDAITLLAAAAAALPGTTVGTLVSRAGVRPAGLLAKEAANLAQISGTAAVLGLGMGDRITVAEHEALGIPFPPASERAAGLEETALAMRTLFAGRPWGGGDHVGPIAGPLLPPADVAVWLGGRSRMVLDAAARAGDGWNGWGLPADAFAERAETLGAVTREAGRDPGELTVSWGGIVLVGQDAPDLAALEADRMGGGLPMDIWRGTVGDLRRFAEALERAGASWFICVPAGPTDRLELVAESLRGR